MGTLQRKASFKQHELTTETVNDYFHIDEMDYEVPLYTAMRLQDKDAIDAILKLNPNVFLGVQYYDKIYFEQKTVAGLYLELVRVRDVELGGTWTEDLHNYMSAVEAKFKGRIYEEWKEWTEDWLGEHPDAAGRIYSILYSYKKLKL